MNNFESKSDTKIVKQVVRQKERRCPGLYLLNENVFIHQLMIILPFAKLIIKAKGRKYQR